MKCESNIYVVGLKGADVGKTQNTWKTCKPRWQTTTNESVDWCVYDCHCLGHCEQNMLLRRTKLMTNSSSSLCEIYQHCSGELRELSFFPSFSYSVTLSVYSPECLSQTSGNYLQVLCYFFYIWRFLQESEYMLHIRQRKLARRIEMLSAVASQRTDDNWDLWRRSRNAYSRNRFVLLFLFFLQHTKIAF